MDSVTTARAPRIFIVEDNPADVYLVRLALKEHGIEGEVRVAAHGDRAMELLQGMSTAERPDLILMDLNLPGKGGIEILSNLRGSESYDQVPVVIMTSSSAVSDRQAAERLGIKHYFRKPTHLTEFIELGAIVRTLLPAFL